MSTEIIDLLPRPETMEPYEMYDEVDGWLDGNLEAMREIRRRPFHQLPGTVMYVRHQAAKRHQRQILAAKQQPLPESLTSVGGS